MTAIQLWICILITLGSAGWAWGFVLYLSIRKENSLFDEEAADRFLASQVLNIVQEQPFDPKQEAIREAKAKL